MIRKPYISQDRHWIYMDFYRDTMMCLTVIIIANAQNDFVKVSSYADLEGLTASEMRDLWVELKKPYISPPEIMEQIRSDVIKHLYNEGRVDLVAVCLDNATYEEAALRL